VRLVCYHCAPKPVTALSLLTGRGSTSAGGVDGASAASAAQQRHRLFLPTSFRALDRSLRGGVRVGTVTEFVGKAGTAKTQLGMQLCVTAAKLGYGCVYVDTEKKLSTERFCEIAAARYRSSYRHREQHRREQQQGEENFRYTQQQQSLSWSENQLNNVLSTENASPPSPSSSAWNESQQGEQHQFEGYRHEKVVLENVIKRSPTSTEELLSDLNALEDEILLRNYEATTVPISDAPTAATGTATSAAQKFPIRLVVVDSIAAPVRRDFGSGTAVQRAAAVIQCAQVLKRLADQLNLCVVVINQIGATSGGSFGVDGTTDADPTRARAGASQAALGTSWHHCVSTRILLECEEREASTSTGNSNESRLADSYDTEARSTTFTTFHRQASVVKSNLVGCGPPISFEVTSLGVVDVPGDDDF